MNQPFSTNTNSVPSPASRRQLYVIRHGERIDFTFGHDWRQHCFDSKGNYKRLDLNMPKSLMKRKGGPVDFTQDSPLTIHGHFRAQQTGEALREKNITISHVYASPALRCVETATAILKGLGDDLPINIEPGLFEWCGWFKNYQPRFASPQDMREAGFNVSLTDTSVWPDTLNVEETVEQFYNRNYQTARDILKRHEKEGGNVLLVAHGASLDTCTRQLVGRPARTDYQEFKQMVNKVPYCAVCTAQQGPNAGDPWCLIQPPILPFTADRHTRFDWTCLTHQS